MRIYFDTEFVDNGSTIVLISIGMLTEEGAGLYFENADIDLDALPAWHRDNVVPHLMRSGCAVPAVRGAHVVFGVQSPPQIRSEVLNFVARESQLRPEFWARYGAYDWVALCQLFGRMLDIPDTWPKHVLDLKQLETALHVRSNDLPAQDRGQHNALADAAWNRDVHAYLRRVSMGRRA